MTIWRKAFWSATIERMWRGAGVGGLLYLGDQFGEVIQSSWAFNAFDLTWGIVGFMLGGAVVELLFSLAGNARTGTGPAFSRSEVVVVKPVAMAPPPDH